MAERTATHDAHRPDCVRPGDNAAIGNAADYLEPATAPANYKDADKIAAYIAEAQAKALDRAALDLDLCRIVAVGFMAAGDAEPTVLLARDEAARPMRCGSSGRRSGIVRWSGSTSWGLTCRCCCGGRCICAWRGGRWRWGGIGIPASRT